MTRYATEEAKAKHRIEQAKYKSLNPEKVLGAIRTWRKRNPEAVRETRRKWRESHRTQRLAHRAVSNGLSNGKLKRPSHCEDCGADCKPEAHHEDYSKPLEVKWLCGACHRKITFKGKPKGSQ